MAKIEKGIFGGEYVPGIDISGTVEHNGVRVFVRSAAAARWSSEPLNKAAISQLPESLVGQPDPIVPNNSKIQRVGRILPLLPTLVRF